MTTATKLPDYLGIGLHVSRPAAPTPGTGMFTMFYETDTPGLFIWDGLAWQAVGGGGSSPLTTKGDLFGHSTVDARIPVGTNGDVLTADSGAALGVSYQTPAGGGINGWEHAFTKPTVAGTTFVNTTNFGTTDDTTGVFIKWNGTLASSDNMCLGHLAVPVGSWDLIARILPMWGDEVFAHGGVHLYESGTGKVITWSSQGTSGGCRLNVEYWSSITAFSSQPKTIACTLRPNWLKIHYDGTNFTFFWSMDGYSWVQFGGNFSKTALFTTGATHAGFFLDPNSNQIQTAVKCLSLTCA